MGVHSNIDFLDQRIDLVRCDDRATAPPRSGPQLGPQLVPPHGIERLLSLVKQKGSICAIILGLPTLLAVFYFALLAANRFESVSTFVVRSPTGAAVSEIANLVQGSGIISSADDAYIVHEYMVSRDAMQELIAKDGLIEILGRSGFDPLWGLPGFFGRPSDERLFRHYVRFISVSFDKTTGISTLKVQAFRAEDAQRIAAALLQKSEVLLNRLNERAQNDAIATAMLQVEASKRRAMAAQAAVTEFRNREAVIDPTLQSVAVLQTVAGLSLEMAQVNAQLSELLKSSPQNPQISSLRLRIAALENQIAKERTQLGGTDTSLAPRIAQYERLMLERIFAEKAFVSALNTQEVAKIDSQRQRTYLEQITKPSHPDYPKYPFRLIWLFAIALGNFALYWMFRHLLNDTLAHAGN